MSGDNQIIFDVKKRNGEQLFTESWNPNNLTPTLGTVLATIRLRLETLVEGKPPLEQLVDLHTPEAED